MNKKDKNTVDHEEISDRVKRRMKDLGLSNAALGEKIGLTEPAVKKLTGGGSSVQYLKLRKLAEALETTPNYLLGVDSGSNPSARQSRALLEAAIEAALQTLGNLKKEHAQQLTRSILSIPDKPALASAALDAETEARTRAEIAAQEYLPAKTQ